MSDVETVIDTIIYGGPLPPENAGIAYQELYYEARVQRHKILTGLDEQGFMVVPKEPAHAMIGRLCDAMEGELDGFTVSPDIARRILYYVLTGEEPLP